MPRPRTTVPSYLHHKPTNQAYVRLPDGNGGRHVVYLGRYDSPESRAEYARIVSELAASPAPIVTGVTPAARAPESTLNEVLLAFSHHAEEHYRRADGTPTNELKEYKYTFRLLRETHGHVPVTMFGPLALKAVRQRMIEAKWQRTTINNRVRRLKHVFKWAAENELVTPTLYQALAAVAGLQKGRSAAEEPEPIGPVADEHVDAILPRVLPPVRAMIQLQRLTGMRPGEVVAIQPVDIDRSGPVWVYRPTQHKNTHRDKPRAVTIGPRAQAILKEFEPNDPAECYFSPRRAVEKLHAERTAARKTPKYPSHLARNAEKRVAAPKRAPADRYTAHSYAVAITRACRKAGVPEWAPNQLRHTHATGVRKRFGLEAAQVQLGHSRADVTQVYAERNLDLALKVAAEAG